MHPKGTILIETGKMLQRGAPKIRKKLGKDGNPLKDKSGNVITEIVRDKNGKIVYEPYEIKVLNTIDFKKSMHYNPFVYIRSEKDILKFVTALITNTKVLDCYGEWLPLNQKP
jgi:type IV secretion system protein VirD4